MPANDRATLEEVLQRIKARLADGPDDLDLQAQRAGLLAALGEFDAAKAAYLAVLAADPAHYSTLNNFGVLLNQLNFRAAARTLFEAAVERHPDKALGHVNFANMLTHDGELTRAQAHYGIALGLEPDNVDAHQQLSEVLRELGDMEGWRRHRRLGFSPQPVRSLPYLGDGAPVLLLVLTSTPAGEIAWPKLVDPRVFAVTTLVADFFPPGAAPPPHGLILNAIGDADLCGDDLRAAGRLIARSTAPVINDPAMVLATSRAENAARLARLPGVVAPRTVLLDRAALAHRRIEQRLESLGFSFPLLLRSPGFHTGRHFVRVDTPADLADAVQGLPGPELLVIAFIDARRGDGLLRKYRVMTIDGEIYPLHLAVSRDWKAHRATTGVDTPAAQAEEARFLDAMPVAIGERAVAALRAVQAALGLDYGGIDFTLSANGAVVVFEANAVMNILPPDPGPQWRCRHAASERALSAAQSMLRERVARSQAHANER